MVTGGIISHVDIPNEIITQHSVSPGKVNSNACNQILLPGAYRKVTVPSRCSLTLMAGTYDVDRFIVADDAELFVAGTVQLNVQTKLSFGNRAVVTGVGNPNDFSVYTNQQQRLRFGRASEFAGAVTAPRAKGIIAPRAYFRGSLAAKRITVGRDAVVVESGHFSKGTQLGYELYWNDQLVGSEPGWSLPRAEANCRWNQAKHRDKDVRCYLNGRRIGYENLGYELYWDGERVGFETGWSLPQGRANCQWNKEHHPDKKVECFYDGQRVGYELYWDNERVGFEPNWSQSRGKANCQWNKEQYPDKTVECSFDGQRLGYELYRDGERVGYEPTWSLDQARANCEWNDKTYPEKKVVCLSEGQRVGYELFWNGSRAGFEPSWSPSRGHSNCEWNNATYPIKKVECLQDGVPISITAYAKNQDGVCIGGGCMP